MGGEHRCAQPGTRTAQIATATMNTHRSECASCTFSAPCYGLTICVLQSLRSPKRWLTARHVPGGLLSTQSSAVQRSRRVRRKLCNGDQHRRSCAKTSRTVHTATTAAVIILSCYCTRLMSTASHCRETRTACVWRWIPGERLVLTQITRERRTTVALHRPAVACSRVVPHTLVVSWPSR